MMVKAEKPLTALPIANQLCAALKAAGVQFLPWKSNNHLGEALVGATDIDMFVLPNDRSKFEKVMAEVGGLRINSQPWARYPKVEDWLVLDLEYGRFLHIHLHYALLTGLKRVKHLQLPWGETLMRHVREDKTSGWPIPEAEMELVILLVRIWAKMPPWRRLIKQRIPSHINKELEWLRSESSRQKLEMILGELFPDIDPGPVLSLVKGPQSEISDVTSVARLLYRQLSAYHRMPWLAALRTAAWRNTAMVVAKVLQKPIPRIRTGKTLEGRGAMIAFVGSDGAGKSTVNAAIRDWLRFKLDVHCFYMGSGDGGAGVIDLIRHAIRFVVRKSKKTRAQQFGEGRSKRLSFFSKSVEIYQLALMHHKIRLLEAGKKLMNGGSIVVLDRYPQDQFLGIFDGPKLQSGESFSWAAKHEAALYLRVKDLNPDLVIKLRIDPRLALHRKPDHEVSVIEQKCKIVDALQFPRCSVVEIDAGQPLDEVLLDVKKAIWTLILGMKS